MTFIYEKTEYKLLNFQLRLIQIIISYKLVIYNIIISFNKDNIYNIFLKNKIV